MAEECDHIHGHCENGDPEACEFLQEQCGYDLEGIEQLLDDQRYVDTEQDTLVTVGDQVDGDLVEGHESVEVVADLSQEASQALEVEDLPRYSRRSTTCWPTSG